MAYPTVSAPYGMVPVNLLGGQVYAGQTRQLPIGQNETTAIFYGDVVTLNSAGNITKVETTATATTIGVFLGCTYTNPSTKQPVFAQYWPASTVASDAQAIVADDPDILFKVAAVSSGTTVAFYGQTVIGNNVALVQNSGSTTTGDSAVGINGSTAAATASLPIRIVAGVPDTANASGEFCEFICKFNAPYITLTEGTPNVVAWNGGHMYNNPTGV
jgi:uncharacterized protein (UPF0333 family)